jgi:HEAT repeat protein
MQPVVKGNQAFPLCDCPGVAILNALGNLHATDAIMALLEKPKDNDASVRNQMVIELSRIGTKQTIEPLFNYLDDTAEEVRKSSAYSLIGIIDKSDSDLLIKHLTTGSQTSQRVSALLLGRLHDAKALPALIERLNDPMPSVQASVISAITDINDKQALEPIYLLYIKHIDNMIPWENYNVSAKALAKLGGCSLVSRLEHYSDNLDTENEYYNVLLRLTDSSDKTCLLNALSKAQASKYNTAILNTAILNTAMLMALGNLDIPPIEPLIEGLKIEDNELDEIIKRNIINFGNRKALRLMQAHTGSNMHSWWESVGASLLLTYLGDARQIYTFLPYTSTVNFDTFFWRRHLLIGDSRISHLLTRKIALLSSTDAIDEEKYPEDEMRLLLSQSKSFARSLDTLNIPPLKGLTIAFPNSDKEFLAMDALTHSKQRSIIPLLEMSILMFDNKNNYRVSYKADAIHGIGEMGARVDAPIVENSLLFGEDRQLKKQAVLALGKLHGESFASRAMTLFEQTQEPVSVKAAAAITLLKFGHEEGLAWLKSKVSAANTSTGKELAGTLGEFSTPHSAELLKPLLANADKEVQLVAIESVGNIKAVELQDDLVNIIQTTQGERQVAATEALGQIGTDVAFNALTGLLWNNDAPMRARLTALEQIGHMDSGRAVKVLVEAIDKDEEGFGLYAYRLLGEQGAKAVAVLPKLKQRFEQIEAEYPAWRKLRDNEPKNVPEEQDKAAFQQHEAWLQKLTRIESEGGLHPEEWWVFPLAQAIARIEPKEGIQLLSHDLADARYGAWTGLGQKADAKLVQRLHKARKDSQDPLFRHAAYRAIDESLMRLEVTANANEDLALLKDLYQTAQNEEGIGTRLAWTIEQIEKWQEP